MQGSGDKRRGLENNTEKVAFEKFTMEVVFHGRYEEEESELCWTCVEGSSGLSHLQILEGVVEGVRKVSAPRRMWTKYVQEWIDWNCKNNTVEKLRFIWNDKENC